MRAYIWLLCFAIMAPLAAADEPAADVYKRVGPGGVVEFSDQPADDAESVAIPPANTYRQAPLPAFAADSGSQEEQSAEPAVSIVSPANDEPVVNTAGELTVRASVEPPLESMPGRRLQFLLDGRPVGTEADPVLHLGNVDRGTHQLAVQLLARDGEVLAESPSSTFHMIRPSVHLPGRK